MALPAPSITTILTHFRYIHSAIVLQVGPGHAKDTDIGPMISPAAVQRARDIIDQSVKQGAQLLLDGRKPSIPAGYEKGNFLGATILSGCKPGIAGE